MAGDSTGSLTKGSTYPATPGEAVGMTWQGEREPQIVINHTSVCSETCMAYSLRQACL